MNIVEYQPAGHYRVLIRVSPDNSRALPFRDSEQGVVRFFGEDEMAALFPGCKYVNIQAAPEVSNTSVSEEEVEGIVEAPAKALAKAPAVPVAAAPVQGARVEDLLLGYIIRAVGARGKGKTQEQARILTIVTFLDAAGLYSFAQYEAFLQRYGLA